MWPLTVMKVVVVEKWTRKVLKTVLTRPHASNTLTVRRVSRLAAGSNVCTNAKIMTSKEQDV